MLPPPAPDHDVVVVGAGAAGVQAARDLSTAGYDVVVLEARDRIGGRTWFEPAFPGCTPVELGGGWISPQNQPMIAEAVARHGLTLVDGPDPTDKTWALADGIRHGDQPLNPSEHRELLAMLSALARLARRLLAPDLPATLRALSTDDISLSDWLDRFELASAPRSAVEAFVGNWFNASPDDFSVLNAALVLIEFGASPQRAYSALSTQLAAGTGSLLQALLEEGDTPVRLGTTIVGIDEGDGAVTTTLADGSAIRSAGCVLAVPVNCWRDIRVEPAPADGFRQLATTGQPGSGFKIWAQVRGLRGRPWLLDRSGPIIKLRTEQAVEGGVMIVGIGNDRRSLDLTDGRAVRDALLRALVLAGEPDAEIEDQGVHDWQADPYSRGGWMALRPGQASRMLPDLGDPVGRVQIAGSDIALRWNGWIEGGLHSGREAARRLGAHL